MRAPSFDEVRRVAVFVLGCLVIIDGLYGSQNGTTELVLGGVMVGVFPLSDLVSRIPVAKGATHEPPTSGGNSH